uniref:Ig-like domain-containing protein n=1 Tax=Esox lucius TaxID=8010 RepID=A0A3P8X9K1_ESOLU
MSAFRRGCGVSLLGFYWVLMEVWSIGAACPASCSCSGTRIACVDHERGIMAFPVLQSEMEMDNITDIYIANQSRFSSINDKDLHYYRNLTNLTVTNSRLTYVSRLAFQNNLRLQYLNLKDNNLSSLSWRIFRHLNISNLILSGNPLHCSCENMWMKLWMAEEAYTQDLKCIAEGGWRKPLTSLNLPHCVVPMATLSPSKVKVREGANVVLTCNTSGAPSPELIWNMTPLVSNYEIKTSGQVSELHLYNLSSLDNNCKITCSAQNIVGEHESSVVLDILFPPNISKLSDAYQDHHWCIPFSVSGNPQPELRWLLKGVPVTEGPYIFTQIHDFSEKEYHGCLQLDSPTHINNGPYTLLASNVYGKDQKTVEAHFMRNPFEGGTVTEPLYYDPTTDDTPLDPPEDRVAVYVVVGIAVVVFTGFLLMLVFLKFGGNSKFGIKGFVLFQNIPVEVVGR